jgi:heme-degrading monooxygenase HmoA
VSSKNNDFVAVWEFWVRPGAEAEFEKTYGPEGAWVRLFSGHPAYGGTKLVRDVGEPRRYLTLDSWESRVACEEFHRLHAEEYRAIDEVCERLTEREAKIGEFEVPSN